MNGLSLLASRVKTNTRKSFSYPGWKRAHVGIHVKGSAGIMNIAAALIS
jgi:hypothetical protein